uniref:Uncharacterized protein n=1 Tax=Candidatus Kentrum sp. FM TaxID=2126340 RepID=A0A450TFS0_9GAMM|nr:MAG: hypothetical protein BECKFM1743C_GA0114222_103874 [Candidatus Kentron sp. FM]VFJ65994.1 MAG: hypothetical protein BECKFM1743A_GA0114220_103975 [Candidatus Kentron sp. FM]
MKAYLQELKQNREFKATEIVKNSLNNAGIDVNDLNKNLLRDISLIQNRTRGPLFELMSEVIIGNVFDVKEFDKQTVFSTPFGKRRIDFLIPEQGVAIEVKSGYGRLRSFIRDQVKKDRYILDHEPNIKQIVWVCFRGATEPLIRLLQENEIEYCDIEYDKLGGQSEVIEKTIIRV